MGRDQRLLHIEGSVSRHNTEQDVKDDFAWESFWQAVRDLMEDPKYKHLRLGFTY
jgi:hypothetical protein